jgi:hypothetical protein
MGALAAIRQRMDGRESCKILWIKCKDPFWEVAANKEIFEKNDEEAIN